MKKILLGIFVLGAVVLVSGCAKKTNPEPGPKGTGEEQKTEGRIISSIKDAIGLGKKMECTYTYKSGEETITTKAYIEGKKYKGESEFMGKKQLMVFDGETMYSWSESEKKGTKWSQSCMEEINKENEPEKNSDISKPTEDEIKDASEAFKDAMDVKCTDVASIDFSVPSDIEFSDMCQQLKEMQEKFKNMGDNLPKGVNVPNGINVPGGMGQ